MIDTLHDDDDLYDDSGPDPERDEEYEKAQHEETNALIKDMMEKPLEKMPLYINDPNKHRRDIAIWRLKIAQ